MWADIGICCLLAPTHGLQINLKIVILMNLSGYATGDRLKSAVLETLRRYWSMEAFSRLLTVQRYRKSESVWLVSGLEHNRDIGENSSMCVFLVSRLKNCKWKRNKVVVVEKPMGENMAIVYFRALILVQKGQGFVVSCSVMKKGIRIFVGSKIYGTPRIDDEGR